MQVRSQNFNLKMPMPQPSSPISTQGILDGITDGLSDGYNSLPRWPKAAVRGMATYAPASIGAMVGSQYAGFPGRLVGAAVGAVASYTFLTEVADVYPRQAKASAAISGIFAAINGGGLSARGVGVSLAWGAGLGVVQELVWGQ